MSPRAGFFAARAVLDSSPNAFVFTDVTNAALSTTYTSNIVTLSGFNDLLTASVVGDGQIRINGGTWVTSAFVRNGNTLQARMSSAPTNSTQSNLIVTVGDYSDTFNVTTGVSSTSPLFDSFIFGTAGALDISGTYGNVVTATAGTSDDQAFCAARTVPADGNWYYVEYEQYWGEIGMAAFRRYAATGQWQYYYLNGGLNTDGVPQGLMGRWNGTGWELRSVINGVIGVTASPSSGLLYDGLAFGVAGVDNLGPSLGLESGIMKVSMQNVQSFGSYNGVPVYPLFTQYEDNTPALFIFSDVSNAIQNTTYTSNTVTITGINVATPVTVTGGTVSINGGGFGSGGTVQNNQTITARGTAGSGFNTATNVVVTVGSVSDTYSITTYSDWAALDWINATNTSATIGVGTYVSGRTLYFPNALNGNSYAVATALAIPQDNNWYYFEWEGNSSGCGGTLGCQTAAHQASGYMDMRGSYDISTWRGIAVRYNVASGTYYNVPIRYDGVATAGPNTMSAGTVFVCAGVHCTKDVATGTYATATLLPYKFQHAYAPDIYTLACGGNTFHNYPTYPLLS